MRTALRTKTKKKLKKKNTSVSRGGLDDGASRLQATVLLGLLNHALSNTILDGASGIEVLALGHYFGIRDKKVKKKP